MGRAGDVRRRCGVRGETSVGYLLGRMLPDLPPIPPDDPSITTYGDGIATVEWQSEYAIGDDGRLVFDGDVPMTVHRPGRVVITATIERGGAA